jgi:hypothetical protein
MTGADAGGRAGGAGTADAGGTPPIALPSLVTSAPNAYWKTDGTLTDSTANAIVTVNDTQAAQSWDGFGGAFNEMGWSVLTTKDMQDQAIKLLFSSTEGAAFVWGRIPMGASDYATSRYTNDDTGTDVAPNTAHDARQFFPRPRWPEADSLYQGRPGREPQPSILGQSVDAPTVDEDRLQDGQRKWRNGREAVVL